MWLTITSGEGKGLAVRIEGERVLIGSGPENRIIIHDEDVDPIHALFEITEGGDDVEVQDLRTRAGTFVNGERISGATALRDGDEIKVGRTVLTATMSDPAESEKVGEPAVEVAVPPEAAGAGGGDADDDTVAMVTAPEGTHIEVVPEEQRRRLRDRVRLATVLAAGAAALAFVAVVGLVVLSGGDDAASTEEIVADVTPSTVLVRVSGALGDGAGSGWVLDADEGLIVTNFHVINGGTGFTVTGQETSADAEVVGAAPCEDLAVLKIGSTDGLKTLQMGSQKDLRQGEEVVAVGYPANASTEDTLTSTAGVVSVVQSSFRFPSPDSPQYANVVQTDAVLNPGNSGGPLVNNDRRLVGVNTAILASAEGAPIGGQGYAIGVDRVKQITEELRKGRSKAWAGFGFLFHTDRQAAKEDLPSKGVLISPALPGTPAEKAKIGPEGALMLEVNGQGLEGTLADYCAKVGDLDGGQAVPVMLLDKPGAKPRTVPMQFG